jgi:preprotein translocase subunit YajC
MPADTMTEMILGFSVIIGVLVVYFLILTARIKRAQAKNDQISENHPES